MIRVKERELKKLQLKKKVVGEVRKPPVPPIKEIDANTKATRELAEAIKSLAERPDLQPLAVVMVRMQETQKQVLEVLLKPKEATQWEFAVKRDGSGNIDKILVREFGCG